MLMEKQRHIYEGHFIIHCFLIASINGEEVWDTLMCINLCPFVFMQFMSLNINVFLRFKYEWKVTQQQRKQKNTWEFGLIFKAVGCCIHKRSPLYAAEWNLFFSGFTRLFIMILQNEAYVRDYMLLQNIEVFLLEAGLGGWLGLRRTKAAKPTA